MLLFVAFSIGYSLLKSKTYEVEAGIKLASCPWSSNSPFPGSTKYRFQDFGVPRTRGVWVELRASVWTQISSQNLLCKFIWG